MKVLDIAKAFFCEMLARGVKKEVRFNLSMWVLLLEVVIRSR